MRSLYGVIVYAGRLPEKEHPEDLADYDILYLSWRQRQKPGTAKFIWVSETAESEIKRFQNVYTAKSYLTTVEPSLAALGAYATVIELEEFKK